MLYYNEYGNKENPTILLLHGAGALDTFCRQYCFSDKYHLVVPHLAGAGKAAAEIYEPEKTVEELFTVIKTLHKNRIGVIGHSLGGQIAIMLVSKNPELFNFAVFLSAWVNPKPKTIRMYCSLAGLSAKMLHWRWLVQFQGKYWNYTKKQADNMAEYSKQITPLVYHSFFSNTLDLSKLPEYQAVTIPMLAICGSKGSQRYENFSYITCSKSKLSDNDITRSKNHDFPMRNAKQLNPMLEKFILECL